MTFHVKIGGTSGLRVRGDAWKTAARVWAADVGPMVKKELQAKAPVAAVNGGGLRKSIKYRTKVLASRAEMTFTAVDYARFVIDGTVAHDIRPRAKKALWWEGAQHPVPMVHHPGTKPNDFVRRAIVPLRPLIQAALDEALAAAIKP